MPDIVIADYDIRKCTGSNSLNRSRQRRVDQTVIIMLSAAGYDQTVIESARELGADTFMVKPFKSADLKISIGTLYHRFDAAYRLAGLKQTIDSRGIHLVHSVAPLRRQAGERGGDEWY